MEVVAEAEREAQTIEDAEVGEKKRFVGMCVG